MFISVMFKIQLWLCKKRYKSENPAHNEYVCLSSSTVVFVSCLLNEFMRSSCKCTHLKNQNVFNCIFWSYVFYILFKISFYSRPYAVYYEITRCAVSLLLDWIMCFFEVYQPSDRPESVKFLQILFLSSLVSIMLFTIKKKDKTA